MNAADIKAQLHDLSNDINALVKVREALLPFANMDRPECDLDLVASERGTACDRTIITSADFRRAAEALNSITAQK